MQYDMDSKAEQVAMMAKQITIMHMADGSKLRLSCTSLVAFKQAQSSCSKYKNKCSMLLKARACDAACIARPITSPLRQSAML